jgi:hypothetical protein
MDWVWRFVNEIDNSLIGFVDWHRYGEWRNYGESGAPLDPGIYRDLLMSKVPDYELRCRAIALLLHKRNILNICGELNCHSHYETHVREHFNHTIFGATFYISSLLYLMRGGADAEMFWTGNEEVGGYGMMGKNGEPRPVYHAKRICAQYIRYGDWISFPVPQNGIPDLDVAVARGDDGRLSALLVHLKNTPEKIRILELDGRLSDCDMLIKIDDGTENQLVKKPFGGTVSFEGYGVAVITKKSPGEVRM